jgi:hypothetical protein
MRLQGSTSPSEDVHTRDRDQARFVGSRRNLWSRWLMILLAGALGGLLLVPAAPASGQPIRGCYHNNVQGHEFTTCLHTDGYRVWAEGFANGAWWRGRRYTEVKVTLEGKLNGNWIILDWDKTTGASPGFMDTERWFSYQWHAQGITHFRACLQATELIDQGGGRFSAVRVTRCSDEAAAWGR